MNKEENKRIYDGYSRKDIMNSINFLIGEDESWSRLNRNDLIKVHSALFNLKYGELGTGGDAFFVNKIKMDEKKRIIKCKRLMLKD